MDIATELRELVKEFEACQIVAFADISAKMILLSSSQLSVPRERLDGLCFEAAALLDGVTSKLNADAAPTMAVAANGSGANVFLRTDPGSSDALCCVCGPGIDLKAFIAAASVRLDHIAQDAES